MATGKKTRAERLLALLCSRKGRRVTLPEVQRIAGAQHGARILELRRRGFVIENVSERVHGETHSSYILRSGPTETPPMFPLPVEQPEGEAVSRFEAARMARQERK